MTRPHLELVIGDEQTTDDDVSTWSLQGLATIGRYELIYELGRGTHGVVYEACDTHLDRSVALKLFNTRTPRDRVYAEATALAQVVHPNVLALHDLCFEAGGAYLVTDVVHGGTLRDRAKASRDWREIVGWYVQAARGLSAIHAEGFVHNDVKPSNILVDHGGQVRVIDLGLSVRVGQIHPGNTPSYLAPERRVTSVGTPHSDQYSLARAVSISLLGGDYVHDLPLRLRLILRRAMALDPRGRFASVDEFAAALERVRSRSWPGAWLERARGRRAGARRDHGRP